MSKKVFIHDLLEGHIVRDDIKVDGRTLVKKGAVLTSSLTGKLRKWFKDSNACVYMSKDDCLTAAANDVNITTCISEELAQETVDGLKNLYDVSAENFAEAFTPVQECVETVIEKIIEIDDMGYDLSEFRLPHADDREEHLFRVAKLAIALAHVYNDSVPVSAEIKLADIAMAALLHDYGKTFEDRPEDIKKLKPDNTVLNKLNVPSHLSRLPYVPDYHAVYAYLALKGKVPEKVAMMVLFSGLNNYTINKVDRYCSEARAAKIIALCRVYDELLEIVIRNNMTMPLENVLSVIAHGVENGDLSKSAYSLFLENVMIYAPGTKVLLTTGEYATVVGNAQFPDKPMVFTDNSLGTPRLINLSESMTIHIKQIPNNRQRDTKGFVYDIQSSQLTNIVKP